MVEPDNPVEPAPQVAIPIDQATISERLLVSLRARRGRSSDPACQSLSAPWMSWEDRAVLRAVNGIARMFRWYHRVRRHVWSALYSPVGFDDLSPSRRHRVALEVERSAARRGGRRMNVEAALFFGVTIGTIILVVGAALLVGPFRQLLATINYYLGASVWVVLLVPVWVVLLVPGAAIVIVRDIRWRRRKMLALLATIRCSGCMYSLVGLHDDGAGLVCPECGVRSNIHCLRAIRKRVRPSPPPTA